MAQDNIQDAIIEEFSMFDDWLDKYDYLISLSDTLPAMDPALRNEKNLIEGCQSRVWVSSEMRDGKMYYSADSDAIITKGIVALLVRVMSGRSAEEVATMELYFIDEIGLGENLSPTRSNGLRAMVKQMKLAALVLSKTNN
ncbi:MAG: SufE family protein [Alistipes sp.]|nr:SufE family protein [Rikenellaceae bacterium]MBQ2959210.1 SufE family protein [Alistipes sp.]MBQ5829603.1 SufE family protein [Alistipes sp.]MBR2436304.1 SufE family protein [Alistipes sp.]MBR3891982.1 SufE family protein [Alistipes sp.]